MLKATDTAKNIKHLQKITKKIIDNYHNDDVQLYKKKDPSLKEKLQRLTKQMDIMEDKIETIQQDAIRGKFFYKDYKRFSPQAILNTVDEYNQVITEIIDNLQKNFPDTLRPQQAQPKKNFYQT